MRSDDSIAALAASALPLDEAATVLGDIAVSDELRKRYREYVLACECVAKAAAATRRDLPEDRFQRLKSRILAAARKPREAIPDLQNYLHVVPHDKLVQFSPGIRWAVLPGDGLTTVYWVFEPPDCGDLPLGTHENQQSGFVLDGKCTLLYAGGQTQALTAGDHYTIPSGVLHGATFQSRTVLCDVYAPARTDFEELYRRANADE